MERPHRTVVRTTLATTLALTLATGAAFAQDRPDEPQVNPRPTVTPNQDPTRAPATSRADAQQMTGTLVDLHEYMTRGTDPASAPGAAARQGPRITALNTGAGLIILDRGMTPDFATERTRPADTDTERPGIDRPTLPGNNAPPTVPNANRNPRDLNADPQPSPVRDRRVDDRPSGLRDRNADAPRTPTTLEPALDADEEAALRDEPAAILDRAATDTVDVSAPEDRVTVTGRLYMRDGLRYMTVQRITPAAPSAETDPATEQDVNERIERLDRQIDSTKERIDRARERLNQAEPGAADNAPRPDAGAGNNPADRPINADDGN